jgi:hypothetical protein
MSGNLIVSKRWSICMYVNGKMRPVETIPGMGMDKGEQWKG